MTIGRAHRAPLALLYATLASFAATIAGAVAAKWVRIPGLSPGWMMSITAGALMVSLGLLGGRAARKLWPDEERGDA
jgi:hypothetical protein